MKYQTTLTTVLCSLLCVGTLWSQNTQPAINKLLVWGKHSNITGWGVTTSLSLWTYGDRKGYTAVPTAGTPAAEEHRPCLFSAVRPPTHDGYAFTQADLDDPLTDIPSIRIGRLPTAVRGNNQPTGPVKITANSDIDFRADGEIHFYDDKASATALDSSYDGVHIESGAEVHAYITPRCYSSAPVFVEEFNYNTALTLQEPVATGNQLGTPRPGMGDQDLWSRWYVYTQEDRDPCNIEMYNIQNQFPDASGNLSNGSVVVMGMGLYNAIHTEVDANGNPTFTERVEIGSANLTSRQPMPTTYGAYGRYDIRLLTDMKGGRVTEIDNKQYGSNEIDNRGAWLFSISGPFQGTGHDEIDIFERAVECPNGFANGVLNWTQTGTRGDDLLGSGQQINMENTNIYEATSGFFSVANWHVYSVEWEPTEIRLLVDGAVLHRLPYNTNLRMRTFNQEGGQIDITEDKKYRYSAVEDKRGLPMYDFPRHFGKEPMYMLLTSGHLRDKEQANDIFKFNGFSLPRPGDLIEGVPESNDPRYSPGKLNEKTINAGLFRSLFVVDWVRVYDYQP